MIYLICKKIFNTIFAESKHIQDNDFRFHIHEYSLSLSPAYLNSI